MSLGLSRVGQPGKAGIRTQTGGRAASHQIPGKVQQWQKGPSADKQLSWGRGAPKSELAGLPAGRGATLHRHCRKPQEGRRKSRGVSL